MSEEKEYQSLWERMTPVAKEAVLAQSETYRYTYERVIADLKAKKFVGELPLDTAYKVWGDYASAVYGAFQPFQYGTFYDIFEPINRVEAAEVELNTKG